MSLLGLARRQSLLAFLLTNPRPWLCEQASILPRLLLPAILGVVFTSFKSRDEAYFWFFIISACIHAGSAFLYLVVHQKQAEARRDLAAAASKGSGGSGEAGGDTAASPGSSVPAGAKLCDRMLFGAEVYDAPSSRSAAGSRQRRRSYTKELAAQRVEDYRRLESSRELRERAS